MSGTTLRERIEALWDERATLGPGDRFGRGAPVEEAIEGLDGGALRVAMPGPDGWVVEDWLKKAVLLSFRLSANAVEPGIAGSASFDRIALKCRGWDEGRFSGAGFRALPGAVVRRGAYVGRDVVLMPSFVNIGAYVGEGTMVDTWSTIGSCAQIGRNCHISGGVGIGGVLEPLQAAPVIIEDDCFVGARSEIAEGVRIEQGAVIAMGVFLGASTRIVDRASGEVFRGVVPSRSVVVPGTMPGAPLPDGSAGPGLGCAVIVKRVDAATRAKTSINDLLRS